MNLAELERKLIAAARSHPPADTVPYAFETRVMAQLQSEPEPDAWTLWGRALWRATTPCLAIMFLLGAWSLFEPAEAVPTADFSQEFEQAVLAAVDPDPTWESNQ